MKLKKIVIFKNKTDKNLKFLYNLMRINLWIIIILKIMIILIGIIIDIYSHRDSVL